MPIKPVQFVRLLLLIYPDLTNATDDAVTRSMQERIWVSQADS